MPFMVFVRSYSVSMVHSLLLRSLSRRHSQPSCGWWWASPPCRHGTVAFFFWWHGTVALPALELELSMEPNREKGGSFDLLSRPCVCFLRGWVQIKATFLLFVCVMRWNRFFFIGMVCTFCFDFAVYIHLLDIEAGLILHLKKSKNDYKRESRQQILITASFRFFFLQNLCDFFCLFMRFQNRLISSENWGIITCFLPCCNSFDKECLRKLIRGRIVVTLP